MSLLEDRIYNYLLQNPGASSAEIQEVLEPDEGWFAAIMAGWRLGKYYDALEHLENRKLIYSEWAGGPYPRRRLYWAKRL